MAKNDFKTAAAKLLAQHSAKKKENLPPRSVHNEQQTASSATFSQESGRRESLGPELAPLVRGAAIPVLAALGCAIMVFLVPETIFGMWFNIVFGLLVGGAFGVIIVREL